LKVEVKIVEQMVSELVKKAKVRPSQDNHRNMVNKLQKGSIVTKQTSQQSSKAQPLKKEQKIIEEEKLKYARSAYLNARRSHMKNIIGYKMEDKHNSRVNNNGQEFIKLTKDNSHQVKQVNKVTNHVSNLGPHHKRSLIHLMFS
jgi:hypothetical protein